MHRPMALGEQVAMTNAPPPPAWSDRQQVAVAEAGRPGGFWIRFVAYVLDAFIVSIAAGVIIGAFVAAFLLSDESIDDNKEPLVIISGVIVMVLALLVVSWLYEALMTSSVRGATLGKQALGLRIVRADGAQLSFGRATTRHFLKVMITPLVPLAIGYLMAAFTNHKRALHDFLADTLVIRSH
jgi:uncharacterized RDD family membrane protein YckC